MRLFILSLCLSLMVVSGVKAQLTEKYSSTDYSAAMPINNFYSSKTYVCLYGGSGMEVINTEDFTSVFKYYDGNAMYATDLIKDTDGNGSDELIVANTSLTYSGYWIRLIDIASKKVLKEWKDPNISFRAFTTLSANKHVLLYVYGSQYVKIYDCGLSSLTSSVVTGDGINGLPQQFSLSQNFPNPFNPSTTIEYNLSKAGPVKLNIYDAAGNLVKTFEQDHGQAGTYQYNWNGTDMQGEKVSSGMYIYQIETGAYKEAKKMIMLK